VVLLSPACASKTYGTGEGKVSALDNISLNIKAGSMIAIMGKSGSGKSTLLNILAGLDKPDSGEYYYEDKLLDTKNGDYMTHYRRDTIGFIVQHFALINDYTVFQNIALPLRYKHIRGSEIKNKVFDRLIILSTKYGPGTIEQIIDGTNFERLIQKPFR
jgi:putative ABC transport system ATP-binding protein